MIYRVCLMCTTLFRSNCKPMKRPVACFIVCCVLVVNVSMIIKRVSTMADARVVLVGFISTPTYFNYRRSIRKFWKKTGYPNEFSHRFILGDEYYSDPPDSVVSLDVQSEYMTHGDLHFVDARENIPNAGKASEKSAAWWRRAIDIEDASFYCKSDDDSLIHPSRLVKTLQQVQKDVSTSYVFLSYIRWRGWMPYHRFQACGGVGWAYRYATSLRHFIRVRSCRRAISTRDGTPHVHVKTTC